MATVRTRVPPVLPILPMDGIPEPFVQAVNSRLRSLGEAIGTTPNAVAAATTVIPGAPGVASGAASPDNSVQFNAGSGVFGGSANFLWDDELQLLSVLGIEGTPTVAVTGGWVQSDAGFASAGTEWNIFNAPLGGATLSAYYAADYGGLGGYFHLKALGYDGNYPQPVGAAVFADSDLLLWNSGGNGTSVPNISQGLCTNGFFNGAAGFYTGAPYYNAIQAPWGGVTAAAIAAVETPDFATGGYIGLNPLGYGDFPGPIQVPAFSTDSLLLWAGTGNGTTAPPHVGDPSIPVGLQCNGYIQSATGFLTNGSATNAIQAPNGGVTAQWLIAEDSLFFLSQSVAPPVSGVGQARYYFDSTANKLMQSHDGSAYSPVGGGDSSATAGGNLHEVQYNAGSGVFGASAKLKFDPGATSPAVIRPLLTVSGDAGYPIIAAGGGYIQSDGGFAVTPATGTQFNVIQATAGGADISAYRASDAGSNGGYIQLKSLSYSGNYPTPLAGATFATSPADVLLWNSGVNGTAGAAIITAQDLCCNATMNAAGGFYTDLASGAAVQAPSGGISAGLGLYSKTQSSPPWDPADGYGGWCHQGDSKYWYYNPSPPTPASPGWFTVDLATLGTGGGPAGINKQVQYNASGVFGASPNLTFEPVINPLLTVSGNAGFPVIAAAGGYIQSDGGFAVSHTNTLWNTIQTDGGVLVHGAVQIGPQYTSDQSAAANSVFLHIQGGPGAHAAVLDTIGTSGVNGYSMLVGRHIEGSFATQNATPINTPLLWIGARGTFPGTGTGGSSGIVTADAASIILQTAETWTSNFQGASILFQTTPTQQKVSSRRTVFTVSADANVYTEFGAVCMAALSSNPTTPAGTHGGIGYKTGSTYWYWGGSAWATINFGGFGVAGSDQQIQYNASGAFGADAGLTWRPGQTSPTVIHPLLTVAGDTGFPAIVAGSGYIQSDGGFTVSPSNTVWNTIQTAGGVRVLGAVQIGASYNTDQNAAANGFLLHAQGGAFGFVVCDAIGSNPIPGVIGRHIEGTLASPTATPPGATLLSLSGRGSYPGGIIGSGAAVINLQAAETWSSSGNNGSQIIFQTTPVGSSFSSRRTVLTLAASSNCYFEGPACLAGFPGSPPSPGGSYGGLAYQSGAVYWYWNGSGWATINLSTLASTSSVVTSLTAGTGVSLSASTGNVTVSIGQNVATNAGVTFNSVVANLFNAFANGTSITYQTSNGQFQVNGNGQVSALEFNCNGGSSGPSGYKINGVVCIDYTGTIVRSVQTSGAIYGGDFGVSGVFVGGTADIQVSCPTSVSPTGTLTLHFSHGLYRNYTTP